MAHNPIRPIKFIRPMSRGSSRPQLILFSDGRHYVVKFKNNAIQGTRALVNEYVAGKLAQLLHLPVPYFQVVYISRSFIMANPNLHRHRFEPGQQFASCLISGAKSHLNKLPPRSKILNAQQLAGILVFDQWVSNVDRLHRNILVKKVPHRDRYKIYMIDHGHSFSQHHPPQRPNCRWTTNTLKKLPQILQPNPFCLWCWRQINSPNEVLRFVSKVEKIPNRQIHHVIASIPKEWNVSRIEKESLYHYLTRMKRKIRALMVKHITNRLQKPYL